MTILPFAPQIVMISLTVMISTICIHLIRRHHHSLDANTQRAHRGAAERTSKHLAKVQRQLAQAFDTCEKDDITPVQ
ncbi:hypothetical protein [Halovulum sp. GXIMD14793]